MFQSRELPVVAVAAVAHGPSDKNTSAVRLEDDGRESCAAVERTFSDMSQTVRECEGGKSATVGERVAADFLDVLRECDGGEPTATEERLGANAS